MKYLSLNIFLLFIISWIYTPKNSFSQNDTSKYITTLRILSVEEGLSSREILCGLQDRSGFVWLGTRNGLNRYDGNSFRHWHRKHGLQEERIVQIVQDQNEHLWILYGSNAGNRNSIYKCDILDLNTLEIKTFSDYFKNAPFKENEIAWFVSNELDDIMIVTKDFKIYLYTKSNKFKSRGDFKIEYNKIVTNHIFHGDDCWLQGNGDKWIYTSASISNSFNISDTNFSNVIIGLNIDTQNNLNGYFLKYVSSELKLIENSFCSLNRLGIVNKRNDLASDFGEVSTIENIYTHYDTRINSSLIVNPPNKFFLFSNSSLTQLISPSHLDKNSALRVHSFFADQQNQYWLLTNAGVFIIKKKINRFAHYFTRKQVEPPLTEGNQIRGIYADTSGNVYACLWQYLMHKNSKNNTELVSFSNIGYSLEKFYEQLYIGTYNMGVYDTKSQTSFDLGLKGPYEIWSMFQSTENNIIFKRDNHFYKLNRETRKIKLCGDFSMGVDKYIYRIFRASDDKIYAAGDEGIFILDNEGIVTDHFFLTSSDASHRIPINELHWLFEDANHIFWLVTKNDGLYRWDRKKNLFRHFTIDNGLSTNDLYCILQDKFGYLWLSSDYGLMRMDTSDFSIKTYTTADGLSHNEFNRISCFKSENGRMFFGGLNGINAFNPEDFISDNISNNSNLEITSFNQFIGSENNMKNLTSELKISKKIILEPGDKFFTMEFALLDFDQSKDRFAYKINGVDKDWNYINENGIRISGLPVGNYSLQIKGQNNEGRWSSKELMYNITVLSHFYEKPWFIITTILLLITAIFYIIHRRTLYLERINAMLETKVGERTLRLQESIIEKESLINLKNVLINEIHHRVKNNLQVVSTLLHLQSNLLENKKLKEILTESQNRIHSIALIHQRLYSHEDFSRINLKDFIEDLYQQVEVVYKNENRIITPQFNVPPTFLDIDTAVSLGLIINELFTNSLKYAFKKLKKGKIFINLSNESDIFELIYRDSGIGLKNGMDIATEKTLGLRLIVLLSKQLNGGVSYSFNSGAEFIIKFKVIK